ncbi:unnamed protein product [Colias eurytheme]|nr:unnamed protein product [Colias eurytheme]
MATCSKSINGLQIDSPPTIALIKSSIAFIPLAGCRVKPRRDGVAFPEASEHWLIVSCTDCLLVLLESIYNAVGAAFVNAILPSMRTLSHLIAAYV